MKKQYSREIVEAEQFTDNNIPEGVVQVDEDFIRKIVIPSIADSVAQRGG